MNVQAPDTLLGTEPSICTIHTSPVALTLALIVALRVSSMITIIWKAAKFDIFWWTGWLLRTEDLRLAELNFV